MPHNHAAGIVLDQTLLPDAACMQSMPCDGPHLRMMMLTPSRKGVAMTSTLKSFRMASLNIRISVPSSSFWSVYGRPCDTCMQASYTRHSALLTMYIGKLCWQDIPLQALDALHLHERVVCNNGAARHDEVVVHELQSQTSATSVLMTPSQHHRTYKCATTAVSQGTTRMHLTSWPAHLVVVAEVATLVCIQERQVEAHALLGHLLDALPGWAHNDRHLQKVNHADAGLD